MSVLMATLLAKTRYFGLRSLFRNVRLNWHHNNGLDKTRILLVSPSVDLSLDKSARISLEKHAKLNFGFLPHRFVHESPAKLRMLENSELIVKAGNCTITSGVVVFVAPNTRLTFGKDTHVISNSRILAYADIEIGDHCIIGWEVQIMSGDGHPAFRDDQWINPPQPIRIGDHVWIGTRATILKGVTIGSGSVIGANAVVTSDVPERCMVAGNPARVMASDITWKL